MSTFFNRPKHDMLKLWAVQHNMSPPKRDEDRPPKGQLPSDEKNVVKTIDPIEKEPAVSWTNVLISTRLK